jgi:putative S-cspCI
MKQIKINNWKKFKVSDLFDVKPTKSYKGYTNKELFNEEGNTPVIVNSKFNNGVGGYSILNNTEKGNIITYSDTTSSDTIFYQKEAFIGYSHIQGLYPKKYIDKWNENSYLFLITILRKEAYCLSVDYKNKFTRKMFSNMEITLPINNNEIDFKYMENYIINLKNNIKIYINNLQKNNIKSKKININSWKRFNLYDKNLFIIHQGNKLDCKNMTENNPEILFVSRSKENNGIRKIVDKIEGIIPYKKGNLTLALGGAYLGSCYVQNKDFYTSQNVIVLEPTWNMSKNIKEFLKTIIFKEAQLYYKAFDDELNRHIKTDFSIPLPVNNTGTPNWEYMENYIKNLEKKVKEKIEKII